jgi:hypothetical protein
LRKTSNAIPHSCKKHAGPDGRGVRPVPVGQNIFEGLDFGVWSSPYGIVANPRTNPFYSVEFPGGGALTPETGTSVSVMDVNVTDHTWNKIIKNIQISNDPNYTSSILVVNSKSNKSYVISACRVHRVSSVLVE